MVTPKIFVEPPKRQPRAGGIKALGPFVRTERILGGADGVQYLSDGCMLPTPLRNGCFDTVVASADKTPDGVGIENGIGPLFAAYSGVECGIDDEAGADYRARAERLLEAGEDRAVEAVLWTWAFDATSTEATDTIPKAIAKAEQYADKNYIGQPVILISRYAADVANTTGISVGPEGIPHTINGTPVIATGAGDPADLTSVAIIGWPTVYDSATLTNAAIHHTTNVQMAIAEKAFGIAVDCLFRHTVTVTP